MRAQCGGGGTRSAVEQNRLSASPGIGGLYAVDKTRGTGAAVGVGDFQL